MLEALETRVSFQERAEQIAKIPYNSAAALYRACGVPVDTSRFGDDCVGQLKKLTENLPQTSTISYLSTNFRKVRHLAAVVDDHYVDPFLFLPKPLSLAEVRVTGQVVLKTLVSDQKVYAVIENENQLVIKLTKEVPNLAPRALLEYRFNLEDSTQKLPEGDEAVNLSLPYVLHFVSGDGLHSRVYYDYGRDLIGGFIFNTDGGQSGPDTNKYCEENLKRLFDLNFEDLRCYFLAANELQKYLLWWKNRVQSFSTTPSPIPFQENSFFNFSLNQGVGGVGSNIP